MTTAPRSFAEAAENARRAFRVLDADIRLELLDDCLWIIRHVILAGISPRWLRSLTYKLRAASDFWAEERNWRQERYKRGW